MFPQCGDVSRGAITLVTVESVPRIVVMAVHHHPIPGHLGENGGCGDREAASIAVYDSNLGATKVDYAGIEEQGIRRNRQGKDGPLHRDSVGGAETNDIQFLRRNHADSTAHCHVENLSQHLFAKPRGQLFGVPDPKEGLSESGAGLTETNWKGDGSGDQRTRQGTAADLVHTRHHATARLPKGNLVVKGRRDVFWPHAQDPFSVTGLATRKGGQLPLPPPTPAPCCHSLFGVPR